MLDVESTYLNGIYLLSPKRISDDRGYFCETYNENRFGEALGAPVKFVQDNESLSVEAGTVRGLHFQTSPYAQGKLVRVLTGSLVDVCVDIRESSPTFGQHISVELAASSGLQLWVPPGFAHGFCTLEPNTTIAYKVTDFYNSSSDRSMLWNDEQLNIEWPAEANDSLLSEKDSSAPGLNELRQRGDLFD